jgi:hypothetical protein
MFACTIAGPGGRPSAIEVGLQDRGNRGIGARADLECAVAGGFQLLIPEAVGVPEDPIVARKPCSGCVFSRRMISISADVFGPISFARPWMRCGVQSAWRRWLDGMCSRTVVCLRFDDERTWTATRLPRCNSSTVRAVIRAHSASRSNTCGAE